MQDNRRQSCRGRHRGIGVNRVPDTRAFRIDMRGACGDRHRNIGGRFCRRMQKGRWLGDRSSPFTPCQLYLAVEASVVSCADGHALIVDCIEPNDFVRARFTLLDADHLGDGRYSRRRTYRSMQNRVVGGMNSACSLGPGQTGAQLRANRTRRCPFEADWEQWMGDDPFRTPGVHITGQVVADSGRVGHRPACVDFRCDRPDFGPYQR